MFGQMTRKQAREAHEFFQKNPRVQIKTAFHPEVEDPNGPLKFGIKIAVLDEKGEFVMRPLVEGEAPLTADGPQETRLLYGWIIPLPVDYEGEERQAK